MTIEEFIIVNEKSLNKLVNEAIVAGADQLVKTIKKRVIDTGKDKSGNSFSAYSAPYLKKKQKTESSASFKNFYTKGTMWKSFKINDIELGSGTVDIVAGMDEDSRGKITNQGLVNVHSDREDVEIIAPSEEEIREIEKYIDIKLEELWA